VSEQESVGEEPEQPPLPFAPPVRIGPDRWRIEAAGEIDLENAGALASACAELLEQSGVTVEIDLGRVSYLDSSGISAMITLLRALESRGGRLRVSNPTGIVARVLELSGVLPILTDQPA
jgi:anti-sigma B factor antagonist